MARILVLYYSMYGHVERMAAAVAEGVRETGCSCDVKRVPETIPLDTLKRVGARTEHDAPVATVEELTQYDGILFGTPTRFGNMSGQMRNFLDQAGSLWAQNALVGKVGGVFTSSATQHGGQESTILTFHVTLLHLGMVVVGLPYTAAEQMGLEEVKGGSPYGAATIAGGKGERMPSEPELRLARFQGRYTAQVAQKLSAGDVAADLPGAGTPAGARSATAPGRPASH